MIARLAIAAGAAAGALWWLGRRTSPVLPDPEGGVETVKLSPWATITVGWAAARERFARWSEGT